MEIKEMLNFDKAEELFHSEAVMIDGDDAIPVTRAVALLGVEAAALTKFYANKNNGKDGAGHRLLHSWLAYDGKTEVEFMTWRGFSLTVSYHNVCLQAEKEAQP